MPNLTRLGGTAFALAATAIAHAGIVPLAPGQPLLPNCPLGGLSWACFVDQAARVDGAVSDFEAIRIGHAAGYGNMAALQIGAGASLVLNSSQTSANIVVGDNVGAAGSLEVTRGGSITINVPSNGNGSGGLFIGTAAAPNDAPPGIGGVPVPSTTMVINDGGSVVVNKPGGTNVAAAVGVGYGPGARSTLILDGGIGGFGVPASPVSLSTTGNISIGRQGAGGVSLFRHATVDANIVYMSAIDPAGQSSLGLYYMSTLRADVVAGLALDPVTGLLDPQSPNHGSAVVSVAETSSINGTVTLGAGGTLYGTGRVGNVSNLGGTLRPGFSPGTLHVDGDYTDIGGTLVIEIGPSAADFLDVMGNISLDGTTIEFAFVDGFAPHAGFSYGFFAAHDPDADPDIAMHGVHYRFSGLQPGFEFSVELDPQSGGARFVALNDGLAVPEPGSAALALVAILAATRRRRRCG